MQIRYATFDVKGIVHPPTNCVLLCDNLIMLFMYWCQKKEHFYMFFTVYFHSTYCITTADHTVNRQRSWATHVETSLFLSWDTCSELQWRSARNTAQCEALKGHSGHDLHAYTFLSVSFKSDEPHPAPLYPISSTEHCPAYLISFSLPIEIISCR